MKIFITFSSLKGIKWQKRKEFLSKAFEQIHESRPDRPLSPLSHQPESPSSPHDPLKRRFYNKLKITSSSRKDTDPFAFTDEPLTDEEIEKPTSKPKEGLNDIIMDLINFTEKSYYGDMQIYDGAADSFQRYEDYDITDPENFERFKKDMKMIYIPFSANYRHIMNKIYDYGEKELGLTISEINKSGIMDVLKQYPNPRYIMENKRYKKAKKQMKKGFG